MKVISKAIAFTATLFASLSVFAAPSDGQVLEQSVLKMGQCVGVNNDEGKEYVFSPKGVVLIRYSTPTGDAYGNEYDSEYGTDYSTEYNNEYDSDYENAYNETSTPYGEVEGTWVVKGQQVLVTENGFTYSLRIGFKSKTCWAQ